MLRNKIVMLCLSTMILLTFFTSIAPKPQVIVQDSIYSDFINFPFISQANWNPIEGDKFYIGQRSSSLCAEHDSYVVPIATAIQSDIIPAGTEIRAKYRIRATHPVAEVHPLDAPWNQWCNEDWTNCPTSQMSGKLNSKCDLLKQPGDTITKVFDNVQEQIYIMDAGAGIGTFEVIINGQSYGQHSGIIFGSRWDSAQSWNHDGVIYANGFTRWKPKGEEPGAETDPCFGTSVVLGPFHIDKPFLSDGYSPNPLCHPKIETINITVETGWEIIMFGAFMEGEQRMMNISWSIERVNISSIEMLVSVIQNAIAIRDIPRYQIHGQYGIGQVAVSSMFADSQKHDSDTQIGPGFQVWVGDIPNSNEGLWGQEANLHQLPEGYSFYLETTTPTTHNTGSPAIWIMWDSLYKDDFLGTWIGQGVYYRNSDTGSWMKMATPATQVTAGNLDGDGTDDLIGIWPGQGGVWMKHSTSDSWELLSSTADWIGAGDMNGDGRDDLIGSWTGQGLYYLDSVSWSWVKMATPATQIAAGDLDGDGTDDLIGIWPGQGGVWVKFSSMTDWEKLSSTADWIGTGDMNGDGRDDFIGTWTGQGVYYLDSVSSSWVKMATPATQIAAGDLDGDGMDDLVGTWPKQGGVWVKYSFAKTWERLSSTADWIACGKMRGTDSSLGVMELAGPFGGTAQGPRWLGSYEDLSNQGPGALNFAYEEEKNLIPREQGKIRIMRVPGPGDSGFKCIEQKYLIPGKMLKTKKEKK